MGSEGAVLIQDIPDCAIKVLVLCFNIEAVVIMSTPNLLNLVLVDIDTNYC